MKKSYLFNPVIGKFFKEPMNGLTKNYKEAHKYTDEVFETSSKDVLIYKAIETASNGIVKIPVKLKAQKGAIMSINRETNEILFWTVPGYGTTSDIKKAHIYSKIGIKNRIKELSIRTNKKYFIIPVADFNRSLSILQEAEVKAEDEADQRVGSSTLVGSVDFGSVDFPSLATFKMPDPHSNLWNPLLQTPTHLDFRTQTQIDFRHTDDSPDLKEDKFGPVLKSMKSLLEYKNEKYGNSALEPMDIFQGKCKVGQRLDDKLARIKNSDELKKNDVADLIGYLTLACVENGWDNFDEFKD
jgi:hypothetical protein